MASFITQGIVVWQCGAGEDMLALVSIGSDDLVLVKGDPPPGGLPLEMGTPVLIHVTKVGFNLRGTWVRDARSEDCDFPCKAAPAVHPIKSSEPALRISRNSPDSVEKPPPVARLR